MKGKKDIMETMNKKFPKQPKKSGFTLLELLVVISIIGILVAMGAAAYSTAQKSGRDARRQSDLKAYQSAQEQYYAENASTYASATVSNQSSLTTPGYLVKAVTDPKSPGTQYSFSNHTSSTYCVCAGMESAKGNSGANCAFSAATTHFCVRNLQ